MVGIKFFVADALTISGLSEKYPRDSYPVFIEWRGTPEKAPSNIPHWAVVFQGSCIDKELNESYEPTPSNRTDEWKERHRFDQMTAFDIASRFANKVADELNERDAHYESQKPATQTVGDNTQKVGDGE